MAGGVLAMTAGWTTIGLDPKIGKELWKARGQPAGVAQGRPRSADRLRRPKGVTVSCLDPKTGKVLWKAETSFTTSAGTTVHPGAGGRPARGFDVKVTANVSANARRTLLSSDR